MKFLHPQSEARKARIEWVLNNILALTKQEPKMPLQYEDAILTMSSNTGQTKYKIREYIDLLEAQGKLNLEIRIGKTYITTPVVKVEAKHEKPKV